MSLLFIHNCLLITRACGPVNQLRFFLSNGRMAKNAEELVIFFADSVLPKKNNNHQRAAYKPAQVQTKRPAAMRGAFCFTI